MNVKSLLLKRLLTPLRAWVATSTLALTMSAAAQDQPQPTTAPAPEIAPAPLPKAEEPPMLPPAQPLAPPAAAQPPVVPSVTFDPPVGLPAATPVPSVPTPVEQLPAAPPITQPQIVPQPIAPPTVEQQLPAAQPIAQPQPELPPVALPANINPGQTLPVATPAAAPESVPAPAAPVAAAPLDLPASIALGLSRQPAIRAAQASLASAIAAKNGLDNIRFGRLLAPDLPIRRQQACVGVNIASAGVVHAEWEARYAITRTYYSVQYARMQLKEIDSIILKLELAHKRAKELVDLGDPNIKVTKIDVDVIGLNVKFVQTRRAEASVGVQKAIAGLREAIGLGCDDPIDVLDEPLPALVHELDRGKLIAMALANRAEMHQAQDAQNLTALEIAAQRKYHFRPLVPTFASGADIHAKPIPQGRNNGDYIPSAIGPEMPNNFAGPKRDRTDRGAALDDRASAVVDKTHNLISLEADAMYLKWQEAYQKVVALDKTDKEASSIYNSVKGRFDDGKGSGDELLRARTLEDQARIQYNEALFMHALALAGLERVTAGGFRMTPVVPVAAAPKK